MKSKLSKSLVLVSVLLLTLAAASGGVSGAAGTITVDGKTTDTSTTSEITNSSTVDNLNGNASNATVVQLKSDSNNSKVEFNRSTGPGYIVATNASGHNVAHNQSGNENNYLNHTVTHDKLLDIEHSIGQNVTMKAWLYNNTSHSDPATSNFTWFAHFTNETHTELVSDSDVADSDSVTIENVSGWTAIDKDYTKFSYESVAVDGANTTIYVAAANTTVNDDFGQLTSDASSGEKVSGLNPLGAAGLVKIADGEDTTAYAPVFVSSVPDDFETSGATYVVLGSAGGTDAMEIHLGDKFEDSSEVDITAYTGNGMGFSAFGMILGYAGAGVSNAIPMNIGGGSTLMAGGSLAFLGAGTRQQLSA